MLLELGLRKGEICGLRWKDVNLDGGQVTIARQLVKVGNRAKGRDPLFGPPKNGRIRTIGMSPELVAILAAHKKHQAEVKMGEPFCVQGPGASIRQRDAGLTLRCPGRSIPS